MSRKEINKLQELIKDLECMTLSREERVPTSSAGSLFEFYNKGFSEGIKLSLGLATHYLNMREEE